MFHITNVVSTSVTYTAFYQAYCEFKPVIQSQKDVNDAGVYFQNGTSVYFEKYDYSSMKKFLPSDLRK